MTKNQFMQVTETKISPKKSIVISRFGEDGKLTLAQKIESFDEDSGRTTSFFCKNPIMLNGVEALEKLRDCLNVALQELNK